MSVDTATGIASPSARGAVRHRTRRRAIVVAGMHRCGTSAITRVLSLLGARLPAELMPPLTSTDPGFWEPLPLAQLHDEILACGGLSWFDVRRFPATWYASDEAAEYRCRLVKLLVEEFGDASLFVAKDPRVCRLIPLWLDALSELECEPTFVLAFRHPLEAARSLQRRDGFSLDHGLLLWLRHVVDAERATRRCGRTFVSYDELLADWRGVVARVAVDLGLEWPKDPDGAAPEIEAFLSPALRHYGPTDETVCILPWVKDAHTALEDAARGNHAEAIATFERVGVALDEADAAYAPLLAAAASRVAELQVEATAAHAGAQRLAEELARRNRVRRLLSRALSRRR
jgi:hypothetical protein